MELIKVKKIKPSIKKIVINQWKYLMEDGFWIIGEQSQLSSFPGKFLVRWCANKDLKVNEVFFDSFTEACTYIEDKVLEKTNAN